MYWKVEDLTQTSVVLDNAETDKRAGRRFLLRYYRVWNLEQCELPQTLLDKLPKIETQEHDPIEAAEQVEEIFGWLKTVAGLRKTRHRGVNRVGWMFTLALAAYNLVRMRNLLPAPA